ncbi:M15 family metallopeptidase [Parabacteroides sp. OttesenSCG-928-G06]|nr:M15 family metallopeptidase [Parabacteroides sp. OttesenSCG-928-K15]MDL2282753.1 M15 family metallopeptidase [Parabacteroides sp. OttesenSCG-928-G06]
MKRPIIYTLLFLFTAALIVAGCMDFQGNKEVLEPELPIKVEPELTMAEKALIEELAAAERERIYNKTWVEENVTRDFLLGKVKRKDNPLFVKVAEEHTERNIYLIPPAYEAFKKMHEAALADGVKLIITSGHRTFMEQACEWELRWNNPRTDEVFANDTEKARFVLQYRSMPGTSRHHWGTDIDINSFKLSYFETREGKKVYDWLKTHAADYGFYQSYSPKDEKRPTGYEEEKWHWSYKPIARLMLSKYLELVTIDDIHGFKGDRAAQKLPIISEWVCGISPEMYETN